MTRCEHDVSGPVRLANHADVAELRFRQEMMRLVDGIKMVDGLWKRGNRVLIFFRTKRKNKSTARSAYAMNFPEMSERIVPEIQSMHRIRAIKRFVQVIVAQAQSSPIYSSGLDADGAQQRQGIIDPLGSDYRNRGRSAIGSAQWHDGMRV
jgi:hypothetical protein